MRIPVAVRPVGEGGARSITDIIVAARDITFQTSRVITISSQGRKFVMIVFSNSPFSGISDTLNADIIASDTEQGMAYFELHDKNTDLSFRLTGATTQNIRLSAIAFN